MAEFTVHGPFRIKTAKRPTGARVLELSAFWKQPKELSRLSGRRGVYVFAIKPSKATTFRPFYVGRATKTFAQEVFADRNVRKYENALNSFRKGYGALFFLEHPKGKTNKKHIIEVEDYLIMMGFAVNNAIENDRGARLPNWAIRGVIRGNAKKPSNAAKVLAAMFDIKSRKGV